MFTLEIKLSGVNGWYWTIRHNGAIVDAGVTFDKVEAQRQGDYFLAKYEREESDALQQQQSAVEHPASTISEEE